MQQNLQMIAVCTGTYNINKKLKTDFHLVIDFLTFLTLKRHGKFQRDVYYRAYASGLATHVYEGIFSIT